MCKIWRQSDEYILRYAPERNVHGRPNGRHIFFSSATLRIKFRLKIFWPVHYPPGSNPHTKNCYPSLLSYKVIGKRRGKKGTEVESLAPSVSPTVTVGAKHNNRFCLWYSPTCHPTKMGCHISDVRWYTMERELYELNEAFDLCRWLMVKLNQAFISSHMPQGYQTCEMLLVIRIGEGYWNINHYYYLGYCFLLGVENC